MNDQDTPEVATAEDQMAEALAEIRAERDAPATTPEPESPAPVAAKDGLSAKPESTSTPPKATEPAKVDSPGDELQKANAELHRMRSEMGRVNALNRLYNEARTKAEQLERENAELKTPKPAADAEQPVDADALLADVAEKVKDFPELSGLVAAVSQALKNVDTKAASTAKQAAAQVVQPLEGLRTEAEQRRAQEYQAAYQAAMQSFQSTYPTAVDVVKSQEFNSWIGAAPKHVQEAFKGGSTPDEAMAVLDAYDAHLRRVGKASIAQYPNQTPTPPAPVAKSASNTQRLAAAAGLPSRSTGAVGGLPPADDFEASLKYFRRMREKAA